MPLEPSQIEQARAFRRQKDDAILAESLGHATQFDPAQQRKVDLLATDLDAPMDSVSNQFADAERISEAQNRPDPAALRANSPRTADWFQEARNARIALDDIDQMQAFERAQDRSDIPFWTNTARGVGERVNSLTGNLIEFAGNVGGDFERKMRDFGIPNPGIVFGEDGISFSWDVDTSVVGSALNKIGEGISEGSLGYKSNFSWENLKGAPTPKNIAGFIVETGAQSMADMAAIMATLPAYLASRTEEIAEQRVINKKEGGPPLSVEEARAADNYWSQDDVNFTELMEAAPTAVLVALSERWATKGILGGFADKVGKVTLGHAGKEVGKGLLREGGQEFFQEQIEYAGETLGTNVEFDINESLDRGFAGAVAGGPIGASIRAVTLPLDAANIKIKDEVVKGLNSLSEQQSIDGMVESIQNTKLFQESPERHEEYLKDMEGDDKLYVTPEEVVAAAEEGLPVPKYMLDEAQGATDVVIPLSKFAMDVMTSEELLTRLRPHLKRSPDSYTQSEIQNRDSSGLDKVLLRAREDKEVRSEAEKIHDDVTAQLVATGRMSKETAKMSASIIPAYVSTKVAELKARDINVTPQEVFEKMNFVVEPNIGTTQKPSNAPDSANRAEINAEIIEAKALEEVKDSVLLLQDTDQPIKLYVDPEAYSETGDVDIEPTWLQSMPNEAVSTETSYVDLRNPLVVDGTKEDVNVEWDPQDLRDLQDKGHDGVWIKSPDGDRVIAFKPGQVHTVPNVVLDQGPTRQITEIQAERSTYEKLLACTKAA